MKKLRKGKINWLITLSLFSCLFFSFFTILPTPTMAVDNALGIESLKLNVPIDNLNSFSFDRSKTQSCTYSQDGTTKCYSIPWLGQYLVALYRYALIIGSIAAVVSFIVGGFLYMFSGINAELYKKARGYMVGSVTGIVLLLGSYLMLQTINPNLATFKPIEIEVVKSAVIPPDFCDDIDNGRKISENGPTYGSLLQVDQVVNRPPGQIAYDYKAPDATCNDRFPVSLKSSAGSDYIPVPEGTTCTVRKCKVANRVCAKGSAGKYACVEVYVQGHLDYIHGQNYSSALQGAAVLNPGFADVYRAFIGYIAEMHLVHKSNDKLSQIGSVYPAGELATFPVPTDYKIGADALSNQQMEATATRGGLDSFYEALISAKINDPRLETLLTLKKGQYPELRFGTLFDKAVLFDANGSVTAWENGICCTFSCNGMAVKKDADTCEYIAKPAGNAPPSVNINTDNFFCDGLPMTMLWLEVNGKLRNVSYSPDRCDYDSYGEKASGALDSMGRAIQGAAQ